MLNICNSFDTPHMITLITSVKNGFSYLICEIVNHILMGEIKDPFTLFNLRHDGDG